MIIYKLLELTCQKTLFYEKVIVTKQVIF